MAMRNEDFRKLLAETPRRSTGVAETPARSEGSQNHTFTHKKKKFFPPNKQNKAKKAEKDTEADEEALRLKKILENYRDRAAERRDKGTEETDEMTKLTAAYRAVPGDSRGATDKAYARMQAIEESKFLGGDMEHTHLVKGLDYSLLHKVRSEIDRTQGDEDEGEKMEKAFKQAEVQAEQAPPKPSDNRMVKNIQAILFKNDLPVRNDLFKKGRMAYVVEMEEETESEVPTTLLRSLIDCPNNESNSNINANNMLISKLTQVLSYLRADHKKKKKPDMSEEDVQKYQSQSIFDNEADYAPKRERERKEEREDRRKTESYFGDGESRREREQRDYDRRDRRREDYDRKDRDREREKERESQRKEKEMAEKEKRLEEKMEKRRKEAEDGGYDECYPGGLAELGGNWGDSDEEEDMTKMDLGNKKSGIKRWDFENEEDYEKFQGGREAMPKAAYQFGVKPQDGRKTRKSVDNKKLDRELGQIEKINEKRKAAAKEGGDYKRPKY